MIGHDLIMQSQRGQEIDRGSAIPCVVTGISFGTPITVNVTPKQGPRVIQDDGSFTTLAPLEVQEVPYCYPASPSFQIFLPPEVGMEGFLIVTDTEISEADSGVVDTSRLRDKASGIFVPCGPQNASFSRDELVIKSDAVEMVFTATSWDVTIGGVSVIAALKQMSAHITALEGLVHPNGNIHGPVKPRLIDDLP